MEDEKLTKIKRFYFRHKRMPTFTEMRRMFDADSNKTVAWIVYKWVDEGVLNMEDKQLAPGDEFFSLPLLGVIRAGSPTDGEPIYDRMTVSLDEYLVGNPGYSYLLRVSGDSMINEGIHSGDLVILDKKRQAKDGDIVAAFVDGQWTLKFLKNQNGKAYLEAANPKYSPIFPHDRLEIGGVVVKVIREYY